MIGVHKSRGSTSAVILSQGKWLSWKVFAERQKSWNDSLSSASSSRVNDSFFIAAGGAETEVCTVSLYSLIARVFSFTGLEEEGKNVVSVVWRNLDADAQKVKRCIVTSLHQISVLQTDKTHQAQEEIVWTISWLALSLNVDLSEFISQNL